MKKTTLSVVIYLSCFTSLLFAQKGKDGPIVVTSTIIVNEYTNLTADAFTGNTSITVANSSLNAHARFSGALAAGDLVMLIQMQGASINGMLDPSDTISIPNDSSWGAITNYNNCGNNEIREVQSVPNGNTIVLSCPLANNYSDTGIVQVVRIPRYSTLTINNGGKLTCDAWDSALGGIVSVEVAGNTIVNAGGSIDAGGLGFRGAELINMMYIENEDKFTSPVCCTVGALKGEGIAGYKSGLYKYGGMFCRASAANGGGGGESVDAGGGGGSNGGVPGKWYNGYGIPDTSNPNYIKAWKLEYTWLPYFSGSGGGRGGYTWSLDNQDPLTIYPGNPGWRNDHRRPVSALGGRPLDYSTGRLFLGGGGGAGHENNNDGGAGGPGGGMIYVISYGTISGGGLIISNGEKGGIDSLSAGDGPGGAGAGGTIVINSTGIISGVTVEANGGTGGNQTIDITMNEAEGPGGGGGGGYIATTNAVTELVNGGPNGTTLSFPTFPANGAMSGGPGTVNIIPPSGGEANFGYTDTTLCPGDSVHFWGVAPLYSNSGVTWKWAFTGGSPSTSTIQNPVVSYTAAGTYTVSLIVSFCGGSDTVTKTIHILPPLFFSSLKYNDSICPSAVDSLKAFAPEASSYNWAGGVSCPTCAYTTANPSITTNYTLTVSNGYCTKDTIFTIYVVSPAPVINVPKDTLCHGDSILLGGSGGITYRWSTGKTSSTIWVKPDSTLTYTLYVTEGQCTDSTKATIHVLPLTTAVVSPNDSICVKGTSTLTATGSGGNVTYKWNTGATTSSITVSDSVTKTYTVTIYGKCDSVKKTVTVFVTTPAKPVITGNLFPCEGEKDTLHVSGGCTYIWGDGSTSSTYYTPILIADSELYVTVKNCFGCPVKDSVILVVRTFSVSLTNASICPGDCATLKVLGMNTGMDYLWSNGATTDTTTVCPDSTANYNVRLSNGCVTTRKTTVVVYKPSLNACCDTTISVGESAMLSASGTDLKWTPPADLKCDTCQSIVVTPSVTTTYTVTGTDAHGCPDLRVLTVIVEGNCFNFTVPNVFTPNFSGPNGVNNVFYINTESISNWSILIYDRWGKEMFKTTNPDVYWTGDTEGGSKAPDGVYYYIISGTCKNNTYKKDGFLQLIR